MKITPSVARGLGIALVVAFAVLSNLWTQSDPGWYSSLSKPSFQPPDVVFGIMWPLNFLALGVVAWVTAERADRRPTLFLALLAAVVLFALAWAYTFYVPHRLDAASLLLGIAALLSWTLVATTLARFGRIGFVLVPFATWMSIATALSFAYWSLNGAGA